MRRWLPVAICCVPGVLIAAVLTVGLLTGGLVLRADSGSPLTLAVLAGAVLAAPVTVMLTMGRRGRRSEGVSQRTISQSCCEPTEGGPVGRPSTNLDLAESDRVLDG